MARSTYIYVALDQNEDIIVVGTVKREVIGRVRQKFRHSVVEIRRYGDGTGGEYGIIASEEWEQLKNAKVD